MTKLTEAQRRELNRLASGKEAKADLLERAGLIEMFTEITLAGTTLSRVERWRFTDAGRAALNEAAK